MAQEWGDDKEPDKSTEAMQMAEASQVDRAAEGMPKSCTDDFKFSRQDPGKLNENVKRIAAKCICCLLYTSPSPRDA